jgi:hypothetical protein
MMLEATLEPWDPMDSSRFGKDTLWGFSAVIFTHADAPPKINLGSSAIPYRPFVLSHQRRSALLTPQLHAGHMGKWQPELTSPWSPP